MASKSIRDADSEDLSYRDVVLPFEDAADYKALLDDLRDMFQPTGSFQEFCVREMAWAKWRLRRAARIRTGMFAYWMELSGDAQDCDENTRLLGIMFYRECGSDAFAKLKRYENSLRRAYRRVAKELESLQSRRSTLLIPVDPIEVRLEVIP
jgi:hypothetical protein